MRWRGVGAVRTVHQRATTAAAEINSKPAIQGAAASASGNCTASGKDLWINTSGGALQGCTSTNPYGPPTVNWTSGSGDPSASCTVSGAEYLDTTGLALWKCIGTTNVRVLGVSCPTCAGAIGLGQGTAPSVVANTITEYAPTSVTGYRVAKAGAAATGFVKRTATGNDVVESVAALGSGDIPNNAANTSGTAADLSSTLSIAHGGTAQTSVPGSSGQFVYNNSGAYGAKAIATTDLPSATRRRSYGVAVGDPAGSALATGVLGYVVVESACTIVAWDIVTDAGTATVDVWKVATGTAKPTVTNTITASAKPAIATGTAIHSTTLTAWTTSIAANDILGFNLDSVATAKYITVDVQCDQ